MEIFHFLPTNIAFFQMLSLKRFCVAIDIDSILNTSSAIPTHNLVVCKPIFSLFLSGKSNIDLFFVDLNCLLFPYKALTCFLNLSNFLILESRIVVPCMISFLCAQHSRQYSLNPLSSDRRQMIYISSEKFSVNV